MIASVLSWRPTPAPAGGAPMRVVIQQPALPLYRVPIFDRLRRMGIELEIIYGDLSAGPASDLSFAHPIPIARIPIGRRSLLWHQAQIRAAKAEADVAILTWDLHYLSLLPSLAIARLRGVRTLLWGHGYSKSEGVWRRKLRRFVGWWADGILVYNSKTAGELIDAGFDGARVFVAHNSLVQEPIQAASAAWQTRPDQLARFQEENRLDGRPVVLFVSRLLYDNHIDVLLHAAAQLITRLPTLRIVVIGDGPDFRRLHRLTIRLGLHDAVTFTGPIYEEYKLAPFFLSATVFCYPVNIGLSLLHAFGYGVPVVTSDDLASQNPEVEALSDKTNGLLYRAGDVGDLCEKLHLITSDPEMRAAMSQAARAVVQSTFNGKRMVDEFYQAILRVYDLPPKPILRRAT